jgi:integrase
MIKNPNLRRNKYKKCPKCNKFYLVEEKKQKITNYTCENIDCDLEIQIWYLDDFLHNYSGRTQDQVRSRFIYIAYYFKEKYKVNNIIDATYNQFLDFFKNDLNKRGIRNCVLNNWRSNLNKYYLGIQDRYKAEGKQFINQVPSKNSFKFSKKSKLDEDFDEKYLTYKTIIRVLRFYYRNHNYKMFILVALMTYTGLRISELVTIHIKDIDLENRKIISGRVKRFSKRGITLSFIPGFFVNYLREYMKTVTGDFLFPAEGAKNKLKTQYPFIAISTIEARLKKLSIILKLEEPINPHAFREAINSEREAKFRDIPDRHLAILINQKPPTVNSQNYLKRLKNWEKIRDLYDQYFPYPYLIL